MLHKIALLLQRGRIGGSYPIPTAPKTDGPKRPSVYFLLDIQFLEFLEKHVALTIGAGGIHQGVRAQLQMFLFEGGMWMMDVGMGDIELGLVSVEFSV